MSQLPLPVASVHVSPTGSDAAPGSAARPLATLNAALARCRQPGGPRAIVLHEGVYPLAAPLQLDARDSGLTLAAAPSESPVLYGGRVLTGWTREADGRLWSAPATGTETGAWDFRQLYVNGGARPRARLPESGLWRHDSVFDQPWLATSGGGFQPPPSPERRSALVYGPEQLATGFSLKNAEFVIYHSWDESQTRAVAHEPERRALTLDPPCGYPPGAFGIRDYCVYNLREGLSRPGQWYLDRDRGRVVYWSLPGETPADCRIEAPVALTLLAVTGTAEAPVEGITLRGLGFDLTGVRLAAPGWGAGVFEGAVEISHVRGCRLDGLRVTRPGGQGLRITHADDTVVDDSELSRCGANGIVFRHGARNAILNCRVRAVGEVYPSAIGINAGYWTRSRIAHNAVADCAYCGITLGNGMQEQAPAENVVEHNTVANVMTAIDDGGCIYLYGIERGTVVRGNDLRGSHGRTGFAMGLYLDENVEEILCEDNRVADAARYPLHVHMGRRNVIRRNRFACGPGRIISFARSRDCVFEDNIVTAPAPELLFANPAGATFRGNAYHTAGGAPRFAEEAESACYGTQAFPKGYRAEAAGLARLAPLPMTVTRFVTAEGADAPAAHRAAFRFAITDGRLAVSARVERPAPCRALAGPVWGREHVELFLKPFPEREALFQLGVAADGDIATVWHGAEGARPILPVVRVTPLAQESGWETEVDLELEVIAAACGGGRPEWRFLAGFTVALRPLDFAEWQARGRDADGVQEGCP